MLRPGQGGPCSVGRSAQGGCLGRDLLGVIVELAGRVGGDLRRGLSELGRLLRRIVSSLQRERGGLGVDQRLVQGRLGLGRVGQGLDSSRQGGLGLLQLLHARLSRQVLRVSRLLSLRAGRLARVGVRGIGLLHGGLEGGDRRFRLPGCLCGRIVAGTRLGLRACLGPGVGHLRYLPGASRGPDGNREGNHE